MPRTNETKESSRGKNLQSLRTICSRCFQQIIWRDPRRYHDWQIVVFFSRVSNIQDEQTKTEQGCSHLKGSVHRSMFIHFPNRKIPGYREARSCYHCLTASTSESVRVYVSLNVTDSHGSNSLNTSGPRHGFLSRVLIGKPIKGNSSRKSRHVGFDPSSYRNHIFVISNGAQDFDDHFHQSF